MRLAHYDIRALRKARAWVAGMLCGLGLEGLSSADSLVKNTVHRLASTQD